MKPNETEIQIENKTRRTVNETSHLEEESSYEIQKDEDYEENFENGNLEKKY